MAEVYIDNYQPFLDSVAASKLCDPKGACQYQLVGDTVSDEFILSKVPPKSREILGDEVGLAIGKAVLWAAFYEHHHADSEAPLLQPWLRADIIKAYEKAYGTSSNDVHNPAKKVTVVPQGCRDKVHLIEIGVDAAGEQIQVEGRIGSTLDGMTSLLSHQLQVQRQIKETRIEVLN